MTHLLLVLNAHGISVPRSVYLLTSQCDPKRFTFLTEIGEENIAYRSVTDNIRFCIEKHFLKLKDCVNMLTLHINVDGLPLFRSSNLNLWPILMTIKESSYLKPLPVAVYCGLGKPKLHDFVSKLVSELQQLKNGFVTICNFAVSIKDVVFICDAPARTYLQCTFGHSASFGCSYCRIVGVKDVGMVFPYTGYENLSIIDREDEMYNAAEENNQHCLSPLVKICSLRFSFPPEFMHVICLGVVRRLCEFYFIGAKGLKMPCKMSFSLKEEVSRRICHLRKYIPSEFSRKIRPVNEFSHYKAVEFRMLLLYFGPFIFKDTLPYEFYCHFLLLHYATYCFCSPLYSNLYFSEARGCIERFSQSSEYLFKNRLQTYNSHVLRHIPEFVKRYGVLDSWSSFIYENFLGILKRRLRCTRGMFKQTINNLNIISNLFTDIDVFKISYSCNPPNNCTILTDDRVIFIEAVIDNFVSGVELSFSDSLYEYPYDSKNLKIGFYRKTNKKCITVVPHVKCIMIPQTADIFLVIPLVNTECFVN